MSAGQPDFRPLNDLERLLVRAAAEEAERPAFARAVLDAQLFVVTPDGGPEGKRIARDGETLALVHVPLEDGRTATAVFTAPERAAQVFGPDTHVVGLLGRDLIGMVAASPLLLNPGLPFGVLWTPEDLATLLGRPVEHVFEKDTRLMLGHPAERPDDLVFRLTRHLHPLAGVQAAWLALAHWPERDETAWYLDVRASLPREQLLETLARAVDGADMAGRMLDMVFNPPGGDPGFGIAIVEPR